MLKFLTTISTTCRCRASRWNGGHICFAKDFPLFSIRRIGFAKLRSFAYHANILVDLAPLTGYLKAAGLRPTNHLSRWWITTAKCSYFRMGLMRRKIGPYGPSPFLSALDPFYRSACTHFTFHALCKEFQTSLSIFPCDFQAFPRPVSRGEKVPFDNVPEIVRLHSFGPLGPDRTE